MYRLIRIVAPVALIVLTPLAASGEGRTADAIRARLQDAARPKLPLRVAEIAGLRQFYEKRGFRPAWVGEARAGARAKEALDVLARARADGLDPRDYAVAEIAARMTPRTADEGAALDLMLSAALAKLAADLKGGRLAAGAPGGGALRPRRRVDGSALLARAGAAPALRSYFATLAPRSARYRRLRRALADYRRIAAGGGWRTLSAGPALRRGMTGDRVARLRHRLAASGDIAKAAGPADAFGAALEAAVRRFQRRHGLAADGIVGPVTRAALNVPVERRIAQIRLNLERRRWMPADLGRRHVFVNTADFVLKVVDGGRTVMDMRVVVGTPYRRTPVFSAEMTHLVFHPYWHIPRSIARGEIAPRARRDPGYLSAQGIRVFADGTGPAREIAPRTVDWARAATRPFPYRLRQDPGSLNPLGRVKFVFPNDFDVYLHDTPARSLFGHDVRAFSHGCIRIAKPVALATYLLGANGDWPADGVRQAMATAKTRRVRLARPVPVHVTYLTAWVNKDGSVHFRNDVYGRDRLLSVALRRASRAAAR